MTSFAGDRGGSFGRDGCATRNWMRAGAPGIARRHPAAESSPIGSDAQVRRGGTWRARSNLTHALILLAATGLVLCSNGIYIYAKAELAQILLHAAWTRTQATGLPVKPWPWADTHPVARLTAAAQEADLLVLSGASGRTLAFGPGHLDGSASPGEPGNSVITAHRDTHFRFLERVAPGDTLIVEARNGARRHFRVRRTYVADYRMLDIRRDTSVPTLTLVTCYPFAAISSGGPLRYVVIAEAT